MTKFQTLSGVKMLIGAISFIGVIAMINSPANLLRAQSAALSSKEQPLTVAETSEFQSTSLSAEVVDFVDACDAHSSHVKKFVFGKTVEGRDMVGAAIATEYYNLGDQDERNVILLLGNIHSGECAGKEALLMLLRELTHNTSHPWLHKNVIVFVPNYNADANDRIGKLNRPGQIGPVNGMGRRENAQELDLNRDFGKLESPEARALVALIDKINPHLFVDCHTTNGSQHQYSLTYDIPHNPTTSQRIRDFMRQEMMPAVTKQLDKQGMNTFYYGNFNAEHTQWTSFGHEPRYSTEYVGLRGRLAILSEAYSYISYKDRIVASKDFLSAVLDYATENRSAIKKLVESESEYLVEMAGAQPERISLALSTQPTPFPEKFTLKGFKDKQPHDYECEFVANYVAKKTTQLPFAYIVPQEFARIIDRLKMHGVKVERLVDPRQTNVEIDTITDLTRQLIPFQRHQLVRAEVTRTLEQRRLHYGDYVIQTDQPLGRLIGYMLESESDDGFVCWDFFEDSLERGSEYPVWRLPDALELRTEEIGKVEKFSQIDLGMIDGPRALLADRAPISKWFGSTNLLNIELYEREMLIDAATASFVERPARPYATERLEQALVAAGVEAKDAASLANAEPQVAVNGKYAIVADAKHAFVYFVEDSIANELDKSSDRSAVLALGTQVTVNHSSNVTSQENDSQLQAGELFEFNRNETRLAYVTSAGLHVLDLDSRAEQLIEAVNEQNLVGKLDWVYQEELYGRGNFQAFWWNTTEDQVAFLSLDESPVIPFTVMDHLPIRGKSEMTNYPKAGDPLPTVKLGVRSAGASNETNWVDLSQYAKDEFLISGVTWSSDGNVLLIQIQNREQTWLDLVATDRDGGNARVLFRDKTPAWIESPGDPAFVSKQDFLWLSPRDGYNRIYKYSLDGKLLATLTSDDWEVRELLGIDPEQRFAYFTGSENGVDLHAYRLNLSTGAITKLTTGRGNHQVEFSQDFSLFLDQFSTTTKPVESRVYLNDGQLLRRLNVNSDDRMEYLKVNPPEFVSVPTKDGVALDAMLIKPPDFNPDKQYPVLVHTYAGPQAPRVRNRFDDGQYLWHQMMAQQGYVVWICDNRSASFRNARNVWPIHKQLASHELADIEIGVEWLKQQPWVDGDRIGIWGWSYGGYMTLYAMTNSKLFKVGIAGAPVTDWKNYDAIYTERYMGLPQNNSAGYEASSVLSKADQLHGKLLLVHGTIDDNVHLNNSIQFVKALQDAGKQFEMMFYPNNRHSVRDKKQAAHLRKLMTDFILNNL